MNQDNNRIRAHDRLGAAVRREHGLESEFARHRALAREGEPTMLNFRSEEIAAGLGRQLEAFDDPKTLPKSILLDLEYFASLDFGAARSVWLQRFPGAEVPACVDPEVRKALEEAFREMGQEFHPDQAIRGEMRIDDKPVDRVEWAVHSNRSLRNALVCCEVTRFDVRAFCGASTAIEIKAATVEELEDALGVLNCRRIVEAVDFGSTSGVIKGWLLCADDGVSPLESVRRFEASEAAKCAELDAIRAVCKGREVKFEVRDERYEAVWVLSSLKEAQERADTQGTNLVISVDANREAVLLYWKDSAGWDSQGRPVGSGRPWVVSAAPKKSVSRLSM